ncbi:alpha-mannosidase [Rubrobacter xylanophilus]|uniref:Alpha-mannosidase n=1 Tax=Rubrobacter xylanophilus TaxID=49319 RepID=A0A510HHP5_9ACTN|nr:glycoside hydrolase family 38 C-terminal domain-containing protein [Rubrobacter xylanophilus]BBL79479.1 alpha-mannosidase [Rubrobacter xylanophilus]
MDDRDRQRLERFVRRIEDLRLWRNALERPVERWLFSAGGEGAWEPVFLGDRWPRVETPVFMRAWTEIPREWAGRPVELELWLGGEGFVRLSNGVVGGLNPFHRTFPVTREARGGERVGVEAEVVSKGLFGSHVSEPRLTRAALVVPEGEVRALELDLSVVAEACLTLEDHDAVPHLLEVLREAFSLLEESWPTETGTVVSRHLLGFEDPLGESARSLPGPYRRKIVDLGRGPEPWSLPSPGRPLEPLPEEAREAVREARRAVAERLAGLRKEHPPAGRVALTGHAHLDLAWLWPLEESRRKARRTFASVLSLMDRYGEFVFNQSSAQMYAWVEEDDPELFARVAERVREGRWEPVGGSWTEPDCQMPSGESFVRQLLHGQRYFRERFGKECSVAWLPDSFGFSPGIPQLLRGAGITGFFTYKLNWNETDRFPHDLFLWEGLDGSRVVAHSFDNPGIDYNGDVVPHDICGTWRNFRGKRHHPETLFSFGWGDGGGGPSERMLEAYGRLKEFPALPRLRMARVEEFFSALPRKGLPRWVGELYLELHRGTLTTQGEIKRLNRGAEHRLLEAEAFSALAALGGGAAYPLEELGRLWRMLLLNQFHDILPGSSIREVCEEARRQLAKVVSGAIGLRDRALERLSDGGRGSWTVANAALHPRPLSVVLPGAGWEGAEDLCGNPLSAQRVAEGLLVHAPGVRVPGLGLAGLRPAGGGRGEVREGVRAEGSGGGAVLENTLLSVEIGADGGISRLYDREAGRDVLAGPANRLVAYADRPREWEAWDIDAEYATGGEELPAGNAEVVEEGPLRASVRVERRWRSSRVVQTYRLLAGSRRLDVETEMEWHERRVLLRALFPVAVRSHEATFETMYGVVRRPTHRNTSWDAARFEMCAHRFCDLSEPDYGVALLNDGRYGHSALDNVLGISLVRGPLYPDPLADEGVHRLTYALYPHPGDWTRAGVVEEAFALNSSLVAVEGAPREAGGFVEVGGLPLALGALKRAEEGEGFVLRFYEPRGARGRAVLRFGVPPARVRRTNLLEEPGEELGVEDGAVSLEVRPFEVVSLLLEP